MLAAPMKTALASLVLAVASVTSVTAQDLKGFLSFDTTLYNEDLAGVSSVTRFSGEVGSSFNLGDALDFQFRVFGTYNPEDSAGSYIDPTIAKLTYSAGDWELVAGYDIVYWGVVESQKIVNVVNQRDQLRDLEGSMPLGQLMVGAVYNGPSASVEAYVLPRFTPLNFGSDRRRLGYTLPVDDDRPIYESAEGRSNVDFALRVSGSAGDLEYGVFAFDGTLRQPEFVFDAATSTLRPFYRQGTQYGLELQYTLGATLLKFEGRHTELDNGPSYQNLVYGAEYVIGSPFGTRNELVLYLEHNWDSRGVASPNVFQNDLFVGARLNISNGLGTSIRVGGYYDLDYGSLFASARVETRLNDSVSLLAQAYLVDAGDPADVLTGADNLDQFSLNLKWNF